MAKRSASRAIVVNQPRQPAPVIRMSMPRPIATRAPPKKRRRSHSKVGGGQAGSEKILMGVAIGGAVLGFLEKQPFVAALPDLPLIGRKGALTLIAYFMHKRGMGGSITRDIAIAGAATSGYQLGKEGKISGPDDE